MSTDERCELSDLPVAWCACRIHEVRSSLTRAGDYIITARFPARFNSYCEGCDAPMSAGAPIARTDDGDYICERCAS